MRILSFLVVVPLILALAVPVQAAEDAWVELLEYSTVNDSGNNVWSFTSSATISIATPQYMRLTKIDLLVSHPDGYGPSSVSVMYSGTAYPLTITKINGTTSRIYGDIPDNLYANVLIQFKKTSTTNSYYQLLSCRVSSLVAQEVVADADVFADGVYYGQSTNISIPAVTADSPYNDYYQIRVSVYDWMKFDQLTIWGSCTWASIDSIRATVDTVGLPFTFSYMDPESNGSWSEFTVDASGDTGAVLESAYHSKLLFCVTIDLSSVDRTLTTAPLYVYFTGSYVGTDGMQFNCQYVNGSIFVADTSSVSWWDRFTTFMSDLFGGNSTQADDYASSMESQAGAMQDAVDEMDSVTKPAVDDVDVALDQYMSDSDLEGVNGVLTSIFSHDLIVTMLIISVSCAFVAYALYGKR